MNWDDTGFEIRALTVWGRARYLSVTEAPHNTEFYTWMGKKHFCFFQTAETGNRTPNSGVKGSGANHYPRAPALYSRRGSGRWPNVGPVSPPLARHWPGISLMVSVIYSLFCRCCSRIEQIAQENNTLSQFKSHFKLTCSRRLPINSPIYRRLGAKGSYLTLVRVADRIY